MNFMRQAISTFWIMRPQWWCKWFPHDWYQVSKIIDSYGGRAVVSEHCSHCPESRTYITDY